MTGYIRINKAELKVKEYETYKGLYCSLCKNLARRYTPLAQLFLSYDLAFLLLLRLSLADNCPEIVKKCCSYNPTVKCACVKEENILNSVSDLAIIISFFKIKDNIQDEHSIKKLAYILFLPIVACMYRKARKNAPGFDKIVSDSVARQRALETQSDAVCVDAAAEPSSFALSKIFSHNLSDTEQIELMSRLGYMLGRWVYLIDAADDLHEDCENDNFNAFAPEINSPDLCSSLERILETTVGEISLAFELLPVKRYRNIISNIIYDGLNQAQNKVLSKYGGVSNEQPL